MGLLDGLTKAGLYGTTGYLTGQNQGDERRRAHAREDAASQRADAAATEEARLNALREALLTSQADAENALAFRRRTPDAPTVRNVDPLSPAGITASAQRADAIAKAQAPYRAPSTSSTAPARTAEQEEAEGLAILNTPMSPEATTLLSAAFRAIRQRNPSMTPGRVTVRAYNGVKKARPDLFSVAAGEASAPAPTIAEMAAQLHAGTGATMAQPGLSPEATARFSGAEHRPATSPAGRWEELVDGGMSEADATAQVKREFSLP